MEGPVAIAEQHRNGEVKVVSYRQVLYPVAIEVPHRDVYRTGTNREALCGLEGPIAVAQQHRDAVRPSIGDRQIELAVTIEVPHGDGPNGIANGEGPRHLEGPIAVSQQHRNRTGSLSTGPQVSHRQIEPVLDPALATARSRLPSLLKSPIAMD